MAGENRRKIQFHLALPTLAVLLFFINAALPVTVLGCFNRGLVALIIAFTTILAGLGTAVMALKTSRSDREGAKWWIVSTLILVIPSIALMFLA